MKINTIKQNYLILTKKEKISILRKELPENLAKKYFKLEKNSFYQKIILAHIKKDQTFLKKILINEDYHNDVRTKAFHNIKENINFYKNIFYNREVLINKKYYKVPYCSKIFNFCKYKVLTIPATIRFIKEI